MTMSTCLISHAIDTNGKSPGNIVRNSDQKEGSLTSVSTHFLVLLSPSSRTSFSVASAGKGAIRDPDENNCSLFSMDTLFVLDSRVGARE